LGGRLRTKEEAVIAAVELLGSTAVIGAVELLGSTPLKDWEKIIQDAKI
jgi:hypothetical protein